MTSQSIYTEYANLTPEYIQWLDGCGARSRGGNLVSNMITNLRAISFSLLSETFGTAENDWYQNNDYTHIPTGSEFCERVAEIQGIEKPVFASDLKDKLVKKLELHDRMERPLPEGTISKTETVAHPHKTYRVLDSLDDIPFDKRIPLSEWIPPWNEVLVFIMQGEKDWCKGKLIEIYETGVKVRTNSDNEIIISLDGHWMRIV